MTWYKTAGNRAHKTATYEHPSGWQIHHCGHPTANWPYFLVAPDGRQIVSHNCLGFKLAGAKAAVAFILCGLTHITADNKVANVTAFGELLKEQQ